MNKNKIIATVLVVVVLIIATITIVHFFPSATQMPNLANNQDNSTTTATTNGTGGTKATTNSDNTNGAYPTSKSSSAPLQYPTYSLLGIPTTYFINNQPTVPTVVYIYSITAGAKDLVMTSEDIMVNPQGVNWTDGQIHAYKTATRSTSVGNPWVLSSHIIDATSAAQNGTTMHFVFGPAFTIPAGQTRYFEVTANLHTDKQYVSIDFQKEGLLKTTLSSK